MSRYLDISTKLAQRVAAGTAAPGEELPSIRTLAREWGTTASTVTRAYQHLADAGVVAVGGRRRARVTADGELAARRLLAAGRTFRLAGSDDPALDLVLRHVGDSVLPVGARGSFHGLTAVSRGTADGAAIHLLHGSGEYNAPYARALLRGRGPTLIHLWRREQGLILPAGNPHGVASAADLRGMRVAKREFGAGTRVLLDRLLIDAGIDPDEVAGPEATAHLEVALAVASGIADAGLGVRSSSEALDLAFVPLAWEHYDIILGAAALGSAAPIIGALRDRDVRVRIGALGGYDLSDSGAVLRLD